MSTLLENRVQSAYPPTVRRSSTISESRPITGKGLSRSHTDTFEMPVPAWRTMTSSESFTSFQRPKTGSIGSSISHGLSVTNTHANEMKTLLRSLDRDDKFIVRVDCLANYRRLVQTVNLRKTAIDLKSLCALQQRENRIVQKNATNDTRFQSLLNTLEPKHDMKKETNESTDTDEKKNLEYPSMDVDEDDVVY